jgi:hypothetical protein
VLHRPCAARSGRSLVIGDPTGPRGQLRLGPELVIAAAAIGAPGPSWSPVIAARRERRPAGHRGRRSGARGLVGAWAELGHRDRHLLADAAGRAVPAELGRRAKIAGGRGQGTRRR